MQDSKSQKSLKVLFVDDEKEILEALRRQLSLVPEIDAYFESNPLKVEDDIEKYDISVIVADIVMPEIDGISLLKDIKQNYPDVIRILLTGHGDYDTSVRAIREAEVFGFITKPWEKDYLYGYLKMAHQQIESTKDQKIPTPLIIYAIWEGKDRIQNLISSEDVPELDELAYRVFMTTTGMFGKKYQFSNNLFSLPLVDTGLVTRGYLSKRNNENYGVFYVDKELSQSKLPKIDAVLKRIDKMENPNQTDLNKAMEQI